MPFVDLSLLLYSVLTENQPLQITLRHWQTYSRVWITFLTKCFSLLLLGNKFNYNIIGY